ncbi:propeptide PepSY amd peptidase M4 [Novosphingobium pentaromativorans US6-1]|uniref:Propeptide PepSY amd peptidase M4 n=1 Tax=Novosphingobium pentaromativorans US6-1 TaxID=1088721 RepID=G6EDK4_9SPHN|nr:propeptide PepSY amd peptidase M4 [Novosphingobium pentaromativorans US6-1]
MALAALSIPLAAYAAAGQDRDEPRAEAQTFRPKVSEVEARRVALVVAHGQIVETEYEKEDGGWRWSFDISENGRIHEIGVDAMTGKVVEDSWEAPGSAD